MVGSREKLEAAGDVELVPIDVPEFDGDHLIMAGLETSTGEELYALMNPDLGGKLPICIEQIKRQSIGSDVRFYKARLAPHYAAFDNLVFIGEERAKIYTVWALLFTNKRLCGSMPSRKEDDSLVAEDEIVGIISCLTQDRVTSLPFEAQCEATEQAAGESLIDFCRMLRSLACDLSKVAPYTEDRDWIWSQYQKVKAEVSRIKSGHNGGCGDSYLCKRVKNYLMVLNAPGWSRIKV